MDAKVISEVVQDRKARLLEGSKSVAKRWVKVLISPKDLRGLLLFISKSVALRYLANLLLNRIGLVVLEINSFSSIDKSAQSVLIGQMTSVVFAPKEEGETQRSKISVFPSIRARHFEEGLINSASSAIIQHGKIFVPDYYFENRNRVMCVGGNLESMHNKLGLIRNREEDSLPKGVAITGLGSSNWYHWLIEILPTAMLSAGLARPFCDYPLLVPYDYARCASFQDSLEPFRLGRSVVALDKSSNCSVGDLVVIDSPVQGPFNLGPGMWPRIADYGLNADILHEFRDTILNSLAVSLTRPTELLFLARSNSRRSHNQGELLEIAERFEFKVVYPETLSFREQVQLFHSARCVVGASGAAWANILFCQSGTRGLTWLFPEYKGFCAYSSLAGIVGMDLSYFFAEASEGLSGTDAAYDMGYHVSSALFTQSLQSILTGI